VGLQADLATALGANNNISSSSNNSNNSNNSSNSSSSSFPVLTFLGTGSSIPSKYRNVSCILVQIQVKSHVVSGTSTLFGTENLLCL